MVTSTLKCTCNAIAWWITGLPYNTRLTNLLMLAHLPLMEAYHDSLLLVHFAIRPHLLPAHHAHGRPHPEQVAPKHLPGLHRLYDLSRHLIIGKLKDRTSTSTADGIPKTTSPNPNKTTSSQELHGNWIRSLPDHTIVNTLLAIGLTVGRLDVVG